MPQEDDEPTRVDDVLVVHMITASAVLPPIFSSGGGGLPTNPGEPSVPVLSPRDELLNALRDSLRADGDLSEEELNLIRDNDVKLSELLTPGLYQMEFAVLGLAEHRQWAYVKPNGDSLLITGYPQDGRLVAEVANFEEHRHGFGDNAEGNRSHDGLRVYAASGTSDPAVAATIWQGMTAAVAMIMSSNYNYNLFVQNSNSVFNTVGLHAGISDFDTGFAPGDERYLFDVDVNNQPPILSNGGSGVIVGSSGSDSIGGGATPTEIRSGAGNDIVVGGSIYDTIYAGDDQDQVTSRGGYVSLGEGDDYLVTTFEESVIAYGEGGNDNISGSNQADKIDGGIGDDTIFGKVGNDSIYGRMGNDTLYGEDGDDKIIAGEGNDYVEGGDGSDIIAGGTGTDQLYGGGGDDTIVGGDNDLGGTQVLGADYIDGGSGDDKLYGSADSDTIIGGDGNDVISGGFSADNLWGGSGADIFVYRTAADTGPTTIYSPHMGVDVIHDFQSGIDKLDLRELDIVENSPTAHDTVGWFAQNGSVFVYVDSYSDGSYDFLVELSGMSTFAMSDLLYSPTNGGW